MEMERPWWLYAACGASLCVHVVLGLTSPSLGPRGGPPPPPRRARGAGPRRDPRRRPAPPKGAAPAPPREKPVSTIPGERPDPSPRLGSGKQRSLLGGEDLFNGLGPKEEKPDLSSRPSGHGENAPLLQRVAAGSSSRPLSDTREGGRREARPDEQ